MRRQTLGIIMLVLLGMTAACNTIHGFGKDVERAGEATQDTADSVRRRM
jgi:predicted small secreted protein